VHVIVVGCGRVGAGLAIALADAGHSVAIIDRKPAAFRRLPENFSGQTIIGIGFDRDRLAEAGIDNAEALAAVTNGDNSNILIARTARETYGIARVVARIYDPRRAEIFQRLGIPTVATVSWATDNVMRRLLPGDSQVSWIDPSAKVAVVERSVTPRWVGHTVAQLEEGAVRVVTLTRRGVGELPAPTQVLQEGDLVHVAVPSGALSEFDGRLHETVGGGH
jgi:trk system potassium uptake protein TrkA